MENDKHEEHMNLYFLYILFATDNYLEYDRLDRECMLLEQKKTDIKGTEKKTEFDSKIFSRRVRRSSSLFGAIIFEALAVEAFINFYAVSKLGNRYFEEHLDKLTIVNKYIIITKLVTGREFPKSDHLYERLLLLVSARNSLVHNKSVKVSFENEKLFHQQINGLQTVKGKHLTEIMKSSHGLCEDLSNLLSKLEQ